MAEALTLLHLKWPKLHRVLAFSECNRVNNLPALGNWTDLQVVCVCVVFLSDSRKMFSRRPRGMNSELHILSWPL